MTTPTDEETLCRQADDALAAGDLHAAADICKALLTLYPSSARGYHLTSFLFHATGNYRKACDYSTMAAQMENEVVQYHAQQAKMLLLLGEHEQALQAFERAATLSGHAPERCLDVANTLVEMERFDEARQWFARMHAHPGKEAYTVDEVRCEMQSGDHEKAGMLLDTILQHEPRSAPAHYTAALHALAGGEFTRSELLLRKALVFDPNHVEARFILALLVAESGDEKAAAEILLLALKQNPTHIGCLLLLGGIFMESGDEEAAEKSFRHVLMLSPEHILAWMNMLELHDARGTLKEQLAQMNPSGPVLRHLRSLFQGNMPPEAPREFVGAFYAALAQMFEPWIAAIGETPHLAHFIKELCALPQMQGKRYISLLDLGCGTGAAARLLSSLAGISVGVDLSPHMLKIARRSRCYDVLYELDITDYVLGSESTFDVVIAPGALRWTGNLKPFFQALRSVMHKDTIFGCMLEKEPSTLAYSVANHGRYSHHYSYIRDIAREEGLELVHHSEYGPETPEDDPTLRHLFFFRKMTVH